MAILVALAGIAVVIGGRDEPPPPPATGSGSPEVPVAVPPASPGPPSPPPVAVAPRPADTVPDIDDDPASPASIAGRYHADRLLANERRLHVCLYGDDVAALEQADFDQARPALERLALDGDGAAAEVLERRASDCDHPLDRDTALTQAADFARAFRGQLSPADAARLAATHRRLAETLVTSAPKCGSDGYGHAEFRRLLDARRQRMGASQSAGPPLPQIVDPRAEQAALFPHRPRAIDDCVPVYRQTEYLSLVVRGEKHALGTRPLDSGQWDALVALSTAVDGTNGATLRTALAACRDRPCRTIDDLPPGMNIEVELLLARAGSDSALGHLLKERERAGSLVDAAAWAQYWRWLVFDACAVQPVQDSFQTAATFSRRIDARLAPADRVAAEAQARQWVATYGATARRLRGCSG